ncbi:MULTISPECIES: hypothetical protein [unclassified Microbacterium]|uniref:hypothetical protein n=1 Tax=unclassified Microbacterium TaxID=2609290 RepID=UPI000A68D406|nr:MULTISPECIES: hypothetical protein [unclassified Microbacterium]MBN9214934.1 hypothetical protein [Microbacterium sp.]
MDFSQFLVIGASAWDILFAALSVVAGWVVAHFSAADSPSTRCCRGWRKPRWA